jgi:hypothetical protein
MEKTIPEGESDEKKIRPEWRGGLMTKRCIVALILGVCTAALSAASEPTGHVTYTLGTENSTTQEGKDAYARIKIAMDSAMYYYNTYTHITKAVKATYVPSVTTADGNINGSIRFGKNPAYQVTLTAMHEIAHTIGVGTTSQWSGLINNNIYIGKNASAKLKEIDGPDAVLKGDNQHFWPYGLNYASEVKSNQDLINHCLIVDAIYRDLYPTAIIVMESAPQPPLSITVHSDMTFSISLPSRGRIEAAVFTLAGQRVADFMRDFELPGDYTINLGRSPLPAGQYVYRIAAGESRKAGVVMVR